MKIFGKKDKMLTDNKILIYDDFLSSEECEEIIKFTNNNNDFENWKLKHVYDIPHDNNIMNYIKKIENEIQKTFNVELDWCQLVKWPQGSNQLPHLDVTVKNTLLTSICYLNDDYLGGRTFFVDDIEIIPKVGRLIIFNGMFYRHGVSHVLGTRYTVDSWYRQSK